MARRRLEDLTDEEKSAIEEIYCEGCTIRETAGRLELPDRVVSRHLRARGLTRGPRQSCGQNPNHPWNIASRATYLAAQARMREEHG